MDCLRRRISILGVTLLVGFILNPCRAKEQIKSELNSAELLNVWAKPGKVFRYMLDDESQSNSNSIYKVYEEDKETLPSWLLVVNNELIGVPTKSDIGSYILNIVQSDKINVLQRHMKISVGGDTAGNDQFKAVPLSSKTNTSKLLYTPIECMPNAPLTVATIIVDLNIEKLSGSQRVKLLQDVAFLAGIHVDGVSLVPGKGASTALGLNDVVILTAGPGDVREVQEQGVALSWQIGCGTDISGMRTVSTLKSSSETGAFRRDLGVPVIGWHITAGMKTRSIRIRREVAGVFNTPGGAGLPTRVMGSTIRIGHATVMVGFTATPSPSASPVRDTRLLTQVLTVFATPSVTSVPPVIPIRPTTTIFPSSSPVILPPVTEEPTTEVTTEISTTEKVTTEEPTTEEMTTEKITTPEVTTEEITTEKPTTEEETTETPTTEEETTETPTTEEATTETPTTEEETTETPTTEEETTKTPTVATQKPVIPTRKRYPPAIYNAIDRINVFENQAFRFSVPRDTFHDKEDGDTTNLKLKMFTIDGDKLAKTAWVQFDSTNQVIYGLPLQARSLPYEFLMVATDKHGMKARDAFEIYVMEEELQVGIEFEMTLNNEFNDFNSDVANRINLLDAIAKPFSSGNFTAEFTDLRLLQYREGSVIVKWAFAEVPYDPCDLELIDYILFKLFSNDEPSSEFVDALKSLGYNIDDMSYVLRGPCAPTEVPPIQAFRGDSASHSWWIGHVIPGVVLAALLLIIGLVVLIFIGCRRKAKLTGEDKKTFIEKKKPIVFVEEFEEKEPFIKQPIIIPNEKPPLPPPAYPRSSTPTASQPATPLLGSDAEDKRSPPYQPPSFTSGREASTGRQPQPSYRLPPPYVAP